MFADSTILLLQFGAAMLMGADYWFKNELLDRMSKAIVNALQPIDDEASRVISNNVRFVAQQKFELLLAVGFLLSAWGGIKVLSALAAQQAPAWVIAASSLFWLFLVTAGAKKFAELLVPLALILSSRIAIRLVTKFLFDCPKGSVFAIGYLLLLASFGCQFINLRS